MRPWHTVAGLTAALSAALVFATGAASAPDFASVQVQPYTPPKPAPAFALPDLAPQIGEVDRLTGEVVMLFFWATW